MRICDIVKPLGKEGFICGILYILGLEGITMIYRPKGVCSNAIDVEVEDGIVKSVTFTGGCNGNLQGISSLVTGMKIEDVIAKLKGIKCGFKNTSCPDQLACALQEILDN